VSTRYVTSLAVGAAVGGFMFGYDTSTMNAAIVGIRSTLALNAATVGFVVAISLIGCAVGAWFAGPIAGRYTRNRVMWIAAALVVIGSLGSAWADGTIIVGAARFVCGLGIGTASAVVPGYIAEIAPTEIRGRLGSFWQFAIVFGQFAGLLIGYLLSSWAGSESKELWWGAAAWRWMLLSEALPAALYIFLVSRLPRTPQDLLRLGEESRARALLEKVGVREPEHEIAGIKKSLQGKQHVTLSALRGSRFGLLPIVWTGIFLAAFQQLVGISVVKTYSNAVWQAVGYTTESAFAISMATVGISIASTVVAIAIMDKVGRRTLLIAGAAVMTLALAGLAVSFMSANDGSGGLRLGHTAGVGALVSINVFAIAFGITWGPITWLMLSELFDTRVRTTAVAVCTAVNWLMNWAVTRTFPLVAGIGLGRVYGLYAIFAAMALWFAWRLLPETRGKTLA